MKLRAARKTKRIENPETRSIGFKEFVRGLMEYAAHMGVQTFTNLADPAWHNFLFHLKKAPETPVCIRLAIGEFDSDGPHPESRELKTHRTGMVYFFHENRFGQLLLDKRVRWDNNRKNEFFGRYDFRPIYEFAKARGNLFQF